MKQNTLKIAQKRVLKKAREKKARAKKARQGLRGRRAALVAVKGLLRVRIGVELGRGGAPPDLE